VLPTQAEGLRQQLQARGAALQEAGRDIGRLRMLLGEAQDAAGDARTRLDAAEAALRAQAAEASALRAEVRLRHAVLVCCR
jgi:chromosome segregation ATPase